MFPPPLFLWYCDLLSVLQEEIKHSGELLNFQKDYFFLCLPHFLAFWVSYRDLEAENTEIFYSLNSKTFLLWYWVKFPKLHLWNTNLISIYFSKLLILFGNVPETLPSTDPFCLVCFGSSHALSLGPGWRQARKSEQILTPQPLLECAHYSSVPACLWNLVRNPAFRSPFIYLFFKKPLIHKWGE